MIVKAIHTGKVEASAAGDIHALASLTDSNGKSWVEGFPTRATTVDPAMLWRTEAARLLWLQGLLAAGVTAVAADIKTLVDDLNKTYQAGFASER